MITRWIKIIDIQATFIGGLKALFHFQVEYLESQFLRFSDFLGVRRDLDVKIGHFYERNTHPLVVKLNGVGRGDPLGSPENSIDSRRNQMEPGPAAIGFSIDAPSEVFAWLEKPGRPLPHLRSAEVRGSKALPISSKRRENFSKTTREALLT